MTAEAINRDRRVAVTVLTKPFLSKHAFRDRVSVTIDAVFQAVLAGANAVTQCLVALMKNKLHMPATHDIFFFYALPLGGNLAVRFQRARLVFFITVRHRCAGKRTGQRE